MSKKYFSEIEHLFHQTFFIHIGKEEDDFFQERNRILRDMRNAMALPEHRKLHPREVLLKMAKEPQYNEFINYTVDPDGTDLEKGNITEQIVLFPITIESNSTIQANICLRNTHIKHKSQSINRSKSGTESKESEHHWEIHELNASSREQNAYESLKMRRILNWVPDFTYKGLLLQKSIWLSNRMLQLCENRNWRWKIVRQIHSQFTKDGTEGVLHFATNKEVMEIEKIVGPIQKKDTKIKISNDESVIFWTPTGPVEQTSTNFLQIA